MEGCGGRWLREMGEKGEKNRGKWDETPIFHSPTFPIPPEVEDRPHSSLCTMPSISLFPSTTTCHNPPQPTSCVLCPPFPYFPPICLHSSPVFQTPQSWLGELVSPVAVSADACKTKLVLVIAPALQPK